MITMYQLFLGISGEKIISNPSLYMESLKPSMGPIEGKTSLHVIGSFYELREIFALHRLHAPLDSPCKASLSFLRVTLNVSSFEIEMIVVNGQNDV